MKATGIVRRIDDLGRIIIPKEIRKRLGIKEGDPLEIFMEGKGIYLEKYSILQQREEDVIKYCRLLSKLLVKAVYITDNHQIIASEGFKRDLRELPILDTIESLNETAGTQFSQLYKRKILVDELHRGECFGEIIVASHEKLNTEEKIIIHRFSNYIINEF